MPKGYPLREAYYEDHQPPRKEQQPLRREAYLPGRQPTRKGHSSTCNPHGRHTGPMRIQSGVTGSLPLPLLRGICTIRPSYTTDKPERSAGQPEMGARCLRAKKQQERSPRPRGDYQDPSHPSHPLPHTHALPFFVMHTLLL